MVVIEYEPNKIVRIIEGVCLVTNGEKGIKLFTNFGQKVEVPSDNRIEVIVNEKYRITL